MQVFHLFVLFCFIQVNATLTDFNGVVTVPQTIEVSDNEYDFVVSTNLSENSSVLSVFYTDPSFEGKPTCKVGDSCTDEKSWRSSDAVGAETRSWAMCWFVSWLLVVVVWFRFVAWFVGLTGYSMLVRC